MYDRGAPQGTGPALFLRSIPFCARIATILIMGRTTIAPCAAADRIANPRTTERMTGGATNTPGPTALAPAPATIALFQKHYRRCHDSDGLGEAGRDMRPTIPDFTDEVWQSAQSDQQLRRSISEGKEKSMPAWQKKLDPNDVVKLVALVRRFQGGSMGCPGGRDGVPGNLPAPTRAEGRDARHGPRPLAAGPPFEPGRGDRRRARRTRNLPALLPDLPWSRRPRRPLGETAARNSRLHQPSLAGKPEPGRARGQHPRRQGRMDARVSRQARCRAGLHARGLRSSVRTSSNQAAECSLRRFRRPPLPAATGIRGAPPRVPRTVAAAAIECPTLTCSKKVSSSQPEPSRRPNDGTEVASLVLPERCEALRPFPQDRSTSMQAKWWGPVLAGALSIIGLGFGTSAAQAQTWSYGNPGATYYPG
jgi:hypothetical protein